jgi:two-component system KDP operon response regulator KdpE
MAHVLIAEDDEATRAMLRMALEEAGHTVVEARDGAAALDILRGRTRPLVVALDMMMTPVDGLHVLRAVRGDARLATQHRYVAMTAVPLSHLDLPADLSNLLVGPVVTKPFRLADFLAAVDEAARQLSAES